MFQLDALESNFDGINGSLLSLQSVQNGTQKQVDLFAIDLDKLNETIFKSEDNVIEAEKRALENSGDISILNSRTNTLSSRISASEQRLTDLENA